MLRKVKVKALIIYLSKNLLKKMNSPRSQLLVFTVNWCRVSQHRLPPNATISNGNKKAHVRKFMNKSLASNFVPSQNFSSTTYYPPDDPFRYDFDKEIEK